MKKTRIKQLLGGGTVFAASQLGKESVGTNQLKKAAVTPAKLSAAAKAAMQGPQRPQGQQDAKGATGARGATGAQGAKGETGPRGETGAKGDTGAKDDQGEPGNANVFVYNVGSNEFQTGSYVTPLLGNLAEREEGSWQVQLMAAESSFTAPGFGEGNASEFSAISKKRPRVN